MASGVVARGVGHRPGACKIIRGLGALSAREFSLAQADEIRGDFMRGAVNLVDRQRLPITVCGSHRIPQLKCGVRQLPQGIGFLDTVAVAAINLERAPRQAARRGGVAGDETQAGLEIAHCAFRRTCRA